MDKKSQGNEPNKSFLSSIKTKWIPCFLMVWLIAGAGWAYGENEEITLQLRWDHQFQFAGYYAALWEGYYEDAGFNVRILSGYDDNGEVISAPREVGEGSADFGIGASDIITYQEEGYEFTVVASIFQRSPVEFYMLEETPYQSLVDLMDLEVGRREDDLLDIELQAMLVQEGMDPELIPRIPGDYDFSIEDLTSGRFDLIPGYLGTIPYQGEMQGVGLEKLIPIEYGIDFYGDSLFTTQEYALANPERVNEFRKASLKGWEYAFENPDVIIDQMLVHFHESERMSSEEYLAYNQYQKDQVLEYTLYPIVSLGNINPYRWEEMERFLVELGVIEARSSFDHFIFDYGGILQRQRERMISMLIAVSIGLSMATVIFVVYYIASKKTMGKLQVIVADTLRENRKQEGVILYQSRLAAMGEMIGHIAHQWRQPLNQLNLMITNLEDAHRDQELEREDMESFTERSQKLIYRMSETIDDFRYFFKPQKEKEVFDVRNLIHSTLELLKDSLHLRDITIEVKENEKNPVKSRKDGFKVKGYGNYFSQGIFNVVHNAIDSVQKEEKIHRRIRIEIYDYDKMVKIIIRDWGKGIPVENLPRIFDLYFTTKDKEHGTGLGLYITKIIVEDHLSGKIRGENLEKGFQILLDIPKEDKSL